MSLVSIIIPVYNGAAQLEKSIGSAIAQTWQQKEVIVVDDGSTDNTIEIARKFEKDGVLVVSQVNKGASAARNNGLSISKGEWIQFLDADDFLREDKIAVQMAALKNETQLAVCKTVHFRKDLTNARPDNDHFFQQYLDDTLRFLIKLYGGFDFFSGMIQPNAFLVSRSLIHRAGSWNEDLSLDDDGEFFCRVILHAKEIVYSPEPMNFYRKYDTNRSLSGAKTAKAYQSQFDSIRLKHEHLLNFTTDNELKPFIHTATFKALQLLMHALYPDHKKLFTEVEAFSKTLIDHPSRGNEVYGGKLANFIGNHVSWKLLKRLQNLKSHLVRV